MTVTLPRTGETGLLSQTISLSASFKRLPEIWCENMVVENPPKVLIIRAGIIGSYQDKVLSALLQILTFLLGFDLFWLRQYLDFDFGLDGKIRRNISLHCALGVSTALELQRQCPGVLVTILADEVSPRTTGDGAAGLFSLFLLGDTPLDKQVQTYIHQTRL